MAAQGTAAKLPAARPTRPGPERRPVSFIAVLLGACQPAGSVTAGQGAREGVTTIMVMPETLPLAEIKAHLSEIVDRVEREHERVVLTRNGRPAAVIMSAADLEALEDTLDLLSDPTAMTDIAAAREDLRDGRSVSAEQLRAKYLRP